MNVDRGHLEMAIITGFSGAGKSEAIATFEDDAGAYDQKDAAGFIKLNALRLRVAAKRGS